jgi:HAD superfamily hydrolase (TIGR01490 family)
VVKTINESHRNLLAITRQQHRVLRDVPLAPRNLEFFAHPSDDVDHVLAEVTSRPGEHHNPGWISGHIVSLSCHRHSRASKLTTMVSRVRKARAHRSTVAGRASAAAADVGTTPRPPTDRRAAAFFDVDNTIMRGASIFHLARGLYSRNFVDKRDIARFGWQQLRFRLAGSESPGHMAGARDNALAFVRGYPVAELRTLGEEIFDEIMIHKVWPGTRALAQLHLDAGQRVWLVTATPVEMAAVIAQRLGLTGALGTVAESIDGVYTGRLIGEMLHGVAKAEAVRALATREGLELERCSAYSDSANDIPMLSLVGYPCAVNPDSKLRAHAQRNGWRIRDYRTGRKAARVGIPTAAGLGAIAGGVAAGMAFRRRRPR